METYSQPDFDTKWFMGNSEYLTETPPSLPAKRIRIRKKHQGRSTLQSNKESSSQWSALTVTLIIFVMILILGGIVVYFLLPSLLGGNTPVHTFFVGRLPT